MTARFAYSRLHFPSSSWPGSWRQERRDIEADLVTFGGNVWGVFAGHFGVPSDELLVITYWDAEAARPRLTEGVATVEEYAEMRPTSRPTEAESLDRSGLYVLRWFEVDPEDVERFIDLSTQAWETFEAAPEFDSEPVGLFAVPGVAGLVDRMLLITWYDNLASWERSRRPADAAQQLFEARAAITRRTAALATKLVAV